MLQSNQIITSLSINDINDIISNAVKTALADYEPPRTDTTTKEPKLIDETELCKRLQKSKPTIWKYRKEGKIPFKRIGKRILYNWQDVYNSLHNVEKREGAI
jgi:predicted DNA-binding transcriptional regulator AlpA